jgi:hypothetical protein
LGAFFAEEPQKTGLSAPIPQAPYGGTAGFPLQSLVQLAASSEELTVREDE